MAIEETRMNNVSRFLLPFSFNASKKKTTISNIEYFTRFNVSPIYLVKAVKELFSSEDNAACKCFYLNDNSREAFDLPPRFTKVSMDSNMRGCTGKYEFSFGAVRLYLFNTGIGFLETEIFYENGDLNAAADISFCIANIFTNEHDSDKKANYNKLIFSYDDQDVKKTFSLKNSLIKLVCGNDTKDVVTLFPTCDRKRLIGYHMLFSEDGMDIDKLLFAFSGMLSSRASYDKTSANNMTVSSVPNQTWSVTPSGCASISVLKGENSSFLTGVFRNNGLSNYYDIFLLAIHEREILLQYNYQAVQNRENNKQLIKMKNKLIQLDVLYTYKTVSTESVYQRLYLSIRKSFNLDSLEDDIRNVIGNVESHCNDKKDRKVNSLLTAISILAIFSILIDGVNFADRVQTGAPFGILQWGAVGIIGLLFW